MGVRQITNKKLEGAQAYPNDCDLIFDSSFESGNLLAAYEYTALNYHLILQNDTESMGFASWFNFIVENSNNK